MSGKKFEPTPNPLDEVALKNLSHVDRALYRVVQAVDHVRIGKLKHARSFYNKARQHANDHVNSLHAENKHAEIADFLPRIQKYFDRVEHLITRAEQKRTSGRSMKSPVNAAAKTPFPKKESASSSIPKKLKKAQELTKAIAAKISSSPAKNPRYKYKSFEELSPSSQRQAEHAFQGKDMDKYHYATDTKSGQFVFTTRIKPDQAQSTKQGAKSNKALQVAPQLSAEHRAGAYVRIDAKGTEHHGRLGMVRSANPNVPDKIKVQIGGTGDVVYVDPSQVRLNKT